MKLSIFRDVNPLPAKKEKAKESRFASNPYLPEVVEICTDEDLINIVCNFAWSPFIFKGIRSKDTFISTDFLVLDIDDGLRIEDAEKRIEQSKYTCLAVPTTSHTPEQHRYRLIFPLSRTITKVEEFEASILDLMEAFPESDAACKDYARFFFGSTTVDGFWIEGDLLEPTTPKVEPKVRDYDRPDTTSSTKVDLSIAEIVKDLYGEEREFIPEAVDFFLKEGSTGLPGFWNFNLNRVCFTLGLQNVEQDVVEDLIAHIAPNPLDKNDLFTIRRSWKQGQEARESE
jgi:hypothetical protein